MLLRNDTPFAAIGFGKLHRDGMIMAVTALRASYLIAADGSLQLANEQDVAMNDIYEGDPQSTPLVRVGDLIPYKPGADVTVLGYAYAPGGVPAQSWQVGVSVGRHEARLRVHGPRRWEPALKFLRPTWKLGPAQAVARVALDYRLAAGGRWVGDWDGRYDRRNPIGPGVLRRDATRVGHPLRAPQIEGVDEPTSDPFATPIPRGFGPIPPPWAFRECHLGTRDEAWQRERCPRAPADYSYRFLQVAHPDLVLPRLLGDEIVQLKGLLPNGEGLTFSLPGLAVIAHHEWLDGREVSAQLALDGVHIDLRQPKGPWLVDLTWRGWIAECPAYHGARLSVVAFEEAVRLQQQGEFGLILAEAVS